MAPILYEVNTRVWLRELSEHAGRPVTLADVPESAIERWKELGFTHIWLMGVWQVGPQARKIALQFWREHWRKEVPSTDADVQGSPYAIQEYAVDASLGDALSLLMLKERLSRAGLRLIIDFVPNHLGIDSTEPVRFPARFVHSTGAKEGTFPVDARFGKRYYAHGRDPYFAPWVDTVQLDYRVMETHQAMTAVAQTASMFGDGLRCDMAMLLLPEIFEETWRNFPSHGAHQTMANFWRKAIPAVKQLQPQVELIAEVYWDREAELQELGFDYTYNKRVCDYLLRRQDAALIEFLQKCPLNFLQRSVHFLENHDEARVASVHSLERHRAAAALILFLPGMALLHDGQLEGRKHFARIQMSKRMEEEADPVVSAFYEGLLKTLQTTHVRRGKPSLWFGGQAVAVKWEGADETDIGIVNLGESETHIIPELFGPGDVSALWWSRGDALRFELGRGVLLPPESAYIVRLKRAF
jgi:glycosidase